MAGACSAGTSCLREGLWCRRHLGTKRQPLPQTCWEGPSRTLQAGGRRTQKSNGVIATQQQQVRPCFQPLSDSEVALEGVTYPPVSRCGHSFPRCGLERVHHSQNLIEVASGGGRVEEGQFQPFVGANDKHLHSNTETESGAWEGYALRVDKSLKAAPKIRNLHSGLWAACRLCPSHRGPACPGPLPTPVCCLLWWERAASSKQTPHNYMPGYPG